jgi:hypothetical protein
MRQRCRVHTKHRDRAKADLEPRLVRTRDSPDARLPIVFAGGSFPRALIGRRLRHPSPAALREPLRRVIGQTR